MSEPRYEVLEVDDGTFAVEVCGTDGGDAVTTRFDNRKQAVEWVRQERRRLGIDERWQEAADD
jgi:hypothetical protein